MHITLDHITYTTGSETLIDDISCTIEDGSAVLIMGPSGSGKTLLMKIMAGILPPESGEIWYGEKAYTTMGTREMKTHRRNQGFAFQDGALWQNLTAYQNLALPIEYHYPHRDPVHIRTHLHGLCAKMAFQGDLTSRPTLLSVGERKVVSILRSLVLDPHIVFMGEPDSGLDSQSAARLMDILKEQKRKGKTLIIGSHDSTIASMIADQIMVIDQGKLLTHDSVRNLVHTENPRIREILADVFDSSSTYDADILDILDSSDDDPFA